MPRRTQAVRRLSPWRPAPLRVGQDPTEVSVDPRRHSRAAVNLAILAGGVVLGLVGAQNRQTNLGAVALQAGGSAAAVALVFFIKDLFSD